MELQDLSERLSTGRTGCPGNSRNTRLHVVHVLPPTWLDEHPNVIAAVAPPPLPRFSPQSNRRSKKGVQPAGPLALSPSSSPINMALHYGSVFPKHMHMLPSEIMLMIFSHLSPDELEQNVSQVCTRWRALAQHASLRRRLSLRGNGVSTQEARRQLAAAKKLLELRLEMRDDIVPLLKEAADSRCKLRKLVIKRIRQLPEKSRGLQLLQRLLLNSDIEELTISFCWTRMLQRPFFTPLKTLFAGIRKLNLSFIPDLCHDDLARIITCCPLLADLRVLMLRRHSKALLFNDQDLTLVGMLSQSLQVLKIEAGLVTDVGMAILTYCRNLRTLCLRELSLVSDEGIQGLLFFRKLECLYLSGANTVTSLGWSLLFNHSRWPMMKKLALIQCSVSDQAANFLIRNYPFLRRLNVLGCVELSFEMIRYLVTCLVELEVVSLCLSQVDGCIYWIPIVAPNIKKIIYHSCSYPESPHIELFEPFAERREVMNFEVFSRSIVLSLDDETGFT